LTELRPKPRLSTGGKSRLLVRSRLGHGRFKTRSTPRAGTGGAKSPRRRPLPPAERGTRPPHRPSHTRGKIGPIGREIVPRSGRWRDRPSQTLSVQVVRSKPRHVNVGAVSASPTPPVSFAHNCSLLSTQPMQRAMFCRPKTWRSSPYMLATQSDKTTTS
jgi:hypothetical protein